MTARRTFRPGLVHWAVALALALAFHAVLLALWQTGAATPRKATKRPVELVLRPKQPQKPEPPKKPAASPKAPKTEPAQKAPEKKKSEKKKKKKKKKAAAAKAVKKAEQKPAAKPAPPKPAPKAKPPEKKPPEKKPQQAAKPATPPAKAPDKAPEKAQDKKPARAQDRPPAKTQPQKPRQQALRTDPAAPPATPPATAPARPAPPARPDLKRPLFEPPDFGLRREPDNGAPDATPLPAPNRTDRRYARAPARKSARGLRRETQEQKIVRLYLQIVQLKLRLHRYYPASAQRRGLSGEVVVSFTIDRRGRVMSHRIVKSSGHKILDRAAIQSLHRAAPFRRLPPQFKTPRITITFRAQYY